MRVAVIRFPGSNGDADALNAALLAGHDAWFVWHRSTDLSGADLVVLPGGFSYGDHLRPGAIARFSPVMKAVAAHARSGGLVLGICNGFQVLCEAQLLPGQLVRNGGLAFVCRWVTVRVENNRTPFTTGYRIGQELRLPVAHGDGRYVADEATLERLEPEPRGLPVRRRQPQRGAARHRRHLQRRRQRGGHHAPPRARRRADPGLGGRALDVHLQGGARRPASIPAACRRFLGRGPCVP